MKKKIEITTLKTFAKKIMNQEKIPINLQKMIDKNFWKLIDFNEK